MDVTVVVSGLPNYAPLKELARNISKITDIKDVGAFRVREIPVDSDKRLVGLDFQDGFDAMDALLLLDGVKYKMGDGKQYMLKCKISKDAQHLPYYNDLNDSYTVNEGRQSRNYEGGCYALVPYNEAEIRNENAKLSARLHLLEKKKKVIEAERELIRAKKKLKKEYFSKTDSDSEDDRCHKCSKASGRREIRSRERSHTPTKYHRSPSTSRKESKSKRKKSKSKKSQSISRRSRSKSRTSRSRSPIVEYIYRTSESRSRSPSNALNVFRSLPKVYKSERLSATVTSSSFRKESTKRRRSQSRSRKSPSRSRQSQSRSKRSQSISRRSQSRARRLQCRARSQSKSRRSPSRSRRSRSRSWSSEFKSKRSNDTSTLTKEDQELIRESAKRFEDAAYLVIREIDNLVYDEKQSLDKNDVEIVLREFKNYVKTEFNKITTEIDKRMSLKEIVRFYRRRRSIEEDKAFLLKLIGELIPKNAKDTVDEKKDDITQRQRRRSIEMWNEVEEVLQEIPMDILQDVEDNDHETNSSSDPSSQNEETQININIRVSYARPPQENCAKASDNSSTVSTLKNTLKDNNKENVKNNEIQNEKNNIDNDLPGSTDKEKVIKAKDNDDPTNISETGSDKRAEKQNVTIDLTNDEGISVDNEVSKPHNNIVSKINEKELSPVELSTDLPQKIVPQNPQFIIPVKRLMTQMKPHIKGCEKVHETIQTAIRARIVDLLKDKKSYLKTPQILTLYRSRYPKESDKLFYNEILENMNKENQKSDKDPNSSI